MSINLGEELVAAYLQYLKGCDFIQQNLYTPDIQGEIDVVGINLNTKTIYVCEVAIHLVTGLRYTKDRQPKITRTSLFTNRRKPEKTFIQNYISELTQAAPDPAVLRGHLGKDRAKIALSAEF